VTKKDRLIRANISTVLAILTLFYGKINTYIDI